MYVKDIVDDKDVLSVLDRATSILNMHSQWSRDPSNQIWLGAFDRHLHAAKPYLAGGRPEPLESTRLLLPYTLIHLASSNTLAVQVLGLVTLVLG